jgi:hypothetical protein
MAMEGLCDTLRRFFLVLDFRIGTAVTAFTKAITRIIGKYSTAVSSTELCLPETPV